MPTQEWREANAEKLREYRRSWYNRNREQERSKARVRTKKRTHDLKEWFKEYKLTLACKLCSENHPATIDFHHRDPNVKIRAISEVIRRGWSKEKILKEIEKCDVLCANCHRKLHYKGE